MIARFKKQTESVLAQARQATENFGEVSQINAVQPLPASVVASIASLGDLARDFRSKMGYEVTFYECGAETAAGEALATLNEMTRDLTEKNTPPGRQKLMSFFKRYPAATRDNQKPLWRYLASVLYSCDKAKKEAESHLQQAQSLDAAGKKSEALREYQEIYRIYPNRITADKIKLLQEQPH
jgi:tetratricopeptide (TPR) repeat protein